ncbi:hypothetical protein GWI33_015288 [Rhynchophorus ferrugineus]|uniref:Uncharacterized protein n=1 Tax=Rhynchophorus ferrugineus TaxID=354439 RepID=A0A834I100_RHYFE|nr:hypothetical protein GWI33_015288 [Rhynchophorus ferrugineus]
MCRKQTLLEMLPKTTSPLSPRRRNIREPMKPRLSRKIIKSARVNLNCYWSQFEEVVKQDSSLVTYQLPEMYTTYYDNEINENLINELLELSSK